MKNYLLRDILRDAVEMAKETGIWQFLTPQEKEELVCYFLLNYPEIMAEADSIGPIPSAERNQRVA